MPIRHVLTMVFIASLVACAPLTLPPEIDPPAPVDPIIELGRKYTDAFYAGQLNSIVAQFSPKMTQALPLERFKAVQQQMLQGLGKETAVDSEKIDLLIGMKHYVRQSQFEKIPQPLELIWSFSADHKIEGFLIRPPNVEAPTRFAEYQTKTNLRLPFEGTWNIVWGGRTVAQNYHAKAGDQRFAYDILIMKDGKSHSGDGSAVENYYAYGKKVLAPSSGVVVASANELPDNAPGKMDPANALGNHVILDHENAWQVPYGSQIETFHGGALV